MEVGRQIHTFRVATSAGTTTFRPGTRQETGRATSKAAKAKAVKPLAFPFFEEVAKHTSDMEWRATLRACARNKFPSKFSCRGSTLSYRRKTKTSSMVIPSDPVEAFARITAFFKEHGSIMTETENEQARFKLYEATVVIWTKWKDVPEKEKKSMICRYSDTLGQMCGLSSSATVELTKTITCGLMTGNISKDDVEISGMKIVNIPNLYWDVGEKRFKVAPNPHKKYKPVKKEMIPWPPIEVKPKRCIVPFAQTWYLKQKTSPGDIPRPSYSQPHPPGYPMTPASTSDVMTIDY